LPISLDTSSVSNAALFGCSIRRRAIFLTRIVASDKVIKLIERFSFRDKLFKPSSLSLVICREINDHVSSRPRYFFDMSLEQWL
jgi:hypothetical protein